MWSPLSAKPAAGFTKIIIGFSMMIMAVLLFLTSWVYRFYGEEMEKQIYSANREQLRQTSVMVEFLSEYAQSVLMSVKMNPSIYYLGSNSGVQDLRLREALNQLDTIRLTSPEVYSIYIYNVKQQVIYTSGSNEQTMIHDADSFYDQEFIELAASLDDTQPYYTPYSHSIPVWNPNNENYTLDIYTYLYFDRYYSGKVNNVVAVNFSSSWINKSIGYFNNPTEMSNYINIVDNKGNLVFSQNSEEVTPEEEQEYIQKVLNSSDKDGYFLQEINGEMKLISYVVPETWGYDTWRFVSIADYHSVFINQISAQRILTIVSAAAIFFVLALIFIMSHRLRRPVQQLFSKIEAFEKQDKLHFRHNRIHFLSQLLTGHYAKETVNEDLERYHLSFDPQKSLRVIAIQKKKTSDQLSGNEWKELFEKEWKAYSTRFETFSSSEENLFIITESDDSREHLQYLKELLEDIQAELYKHTENFQLCITISSCGHTYRDLPFLYREALKLQSCFFSPAFQAKTVDEPQMAFLPYTDEAITVDGVLDEALWSSASYQLQKNLLDIEANNQADFSAAWDQENLYIGVRIADANVVNENRPDSEIYEDDGIEIFIDGDNSKTENQYDENDHQIFIRCDGSVYTTQGGTQTELSQSVSVAAGSTDTGYCIEAAIPWEQLGQTAADGKLIGLDIANNDNDGEGSRSAVLSWNAEANENWKNPAGFGTAILYEKNLPVIADSGTPEMDGQMDSLWNLEHSFMVGEHTISFDAICDESNLYVGILREKADPSAETTEENVLITFDGDYDRSGPLNQYDNGLTYHPDTNTFDVYPTYSWTGTEYLSGETETGYFLELKIPLKNLLPIIQNHAIMGFDICAQYDDASGHYWNVWNGKGDNWQSNSAYGVLTIENPAITSNQLPVLPVQLTSSIQQAASASGTVSGTDPDGDSITYSIPEDKMPSNGTATVDAQSGAWSYTPAEDFIGVDNFWIEASDGNGGTSSVRMAMEVNYAPANRTLYVDGINGSDENDGLSVESAFKSIQAAHDISLPGDTIYIMDGVYGQTSNEGSLVISRSGLPDAYITYKAYPVLNSGDAWNTILVASASYIRIDGLTVEGISDSITEEEAMAVYDRFAAGDISWGKETSATNTNGIAIRPQTRVDNNGGLDTVVIPHHIEVRNCVVTKVAAGGICVEQADYVIIENNDVSETCHWDIFGSSGISVFHSLNTDDNTDSYKNIIRNNRSYRNYHNIPWYSVGRMSDGNGIILDDNKNTQIGSLPYQGKTLVANNLVYENGGTGMHAYSCRNVDIINNTSWNNNATPELTWGEITAGDCENVNLINNISYARTGNPVNKNDNNQNVVYDFNIYYNGTVTTSGPNDLETDPLFTDIENRDFTVQEDSPAVGSASPEWAAAVGNESLLRGYFDTVGVDRNDSICDVEGHQWDDGKVIQEATPEQDGVIRYTCTVCGEIREESLQYQAGSNTPETGDFSQPWVLLWGAAVSAVALLALRRYMALRHTGKRS